MTRHNLMAETVAAVKTPACHAGARQTRFRLAASYDAVNREAAEIISSNAAHHGSDGSITVIWARLVRSNAESSRASWRLA